MRFSFIVTFTTFSGRESIRRFSVGAASVEQAQTIAGSVAIILGRLPGDARIESNAGEESLEVTFEQVIFWALTGAV